MLQFVQEPKKRSGDVRTRFEDGVLRIAIDGHFNVGLSSEVREAIKSGLDAGVPEMIIDMRRVDYIDSSGIGTLVMAWKGLNRAGGTLKVIGVPEQARKLLKFPPFSKDGLLNPEVFPE